MRKYKIKTQFKEELEPEEILFDSEKKKEEERKGRIEIMIKNSVFSVLFALLLLMFFSLFFRTAYLIEARGEELGIEAVDNYLRVSYIEAPRGIIYSKDKTVLVENVKEKKEKVDEAGNEILSETFLRNYLEGSSCFSHLFGYINEVLPGEIEKDSYYEGGDRKGREGIEKEYEEFLRGKKGRNERVVNALGEFVVPEKIVFDPIKGNDLVLNIDSGLQKKIYETIEKKVPDKNASAVAINPQNGKVLAMVSFPSYDNNLISEKYVEYSNDPRKPFLNRALSGKYPSGSVIKPLIAAAGLEENIITPETKINCKGRILMPNPYGLPESKKDWKTHGITDLNKAIAESCNIYFFVVGGGGYQDIYGSEIEGLGSKKIKEYLDLFYIEDELGIDIPGEKAGFVPTKEWFDKERKEREYFEKRNWSIADIYDTSIGQGFFQSTPLHMASALSAIANGGKVYQPQIVDKITDIGGKTIEDFQPKILEENFIGEENIEAVREGMRECVLSSSGSCRQLQGLPVSSAGKTGTAETEGDKEPHAWFVSFAPYENPKILLLVMVEYGGGGSKVAAPIAKEVLEWQYSR